MKAKAAVFMGANKDFEVREFEVTKCPKGYGQMQLISSGVCGTDIHFYKGKLGIVGAIHTRGYSFVTPSTVTVAFFGLYLKRSPFIAIAV